MSEDQPAANKTTKNYGPLPTTSRSGFQPSWKWEAGWLLAIALLAGIILVFAWMFR